MKLQMISWYVRKGTFVLRSLATEGGKHFIVFQLFCQSRFITSRLDWGRVLVSSRAGLPARCNKSKLITQWNFTPVVKSTSHLLLIPHHLSFDLYHKVTITLQQSSHLKYILVKPPKSNQTPQTGYRPRKSKSMSDSECGDCVIFTFIDTDPEIQNQILIQILTVAAVSYSHSWIQTPKIKIDVRFWLWRLRRIHWWEGRQAGRDWNDWPIDNNGRNVCGETFPSTKHWNNDWKALIRLTG